jgi:hypothetical protein
MNDLLGSTLGQHFQPVSPLRFLHYPPFIPLPLFLHSPCLSLLFDSSSLFLYYNHFSIILNCKCHVFTYG